MTMNPKWTELNAKWRAKLPFTNDDILAALDEEIAENGPVVAHTIEVRAWFAKTGILTRRLYCYLLPRLVRRCEICGRRAIYRYGAHGRCRQHKAAASDGFRIRQLLLERSNSAIERDLDDADRRARQRDDAHRLHLGRKGKA